MEQLTNKDRALLAIVFETTRRKDIEKLINIADTELAKRIIANYMRMYSDLLE